MKGYCQIDGSFNFNEKEKKVKSAKCVNQIKTGKRIIY